MASTGWTEEQSTGMLQHQLGKESILDGSFHSRSSFKEPGQGETYDKTLFNLCYLVQMQIGIFFKQEEFDERKFCRYYLKAYKQLKEMDKVKERGIKFSKAFSEFTILVYHNVFGSSVSPTDLQASQQTTSAKLELKRKVTFAGSDQEACSSLGLPKIDEDSDQSQRNNSLSPSEKGRKKLERANKKLSTKNKDSVECAEYQVDMKGAQSIRQSPKEETVRIKPPKLNITSEVELARHFISGTPTDIPSDKLPRDTLAKSQAFSELNVIEVKDPQLSNRSKKVKPQLVTKGVKNITEVYSPNNNQLQARVNWRSGSMHDVPSSSKDRLDTTDNNSKSSKQHQKKKSSNTRQQSIDSPTDQLVKRSEKLGAAKSKTERDALAKDLNVNINQVLANNLKSGSYVLEQDGTCPSDSARSQSKVEDHANKNAHKQNQNKLKGRDKGNTRNNLRNERESRTHDSEIGKNSDSQYHTQLDNCTIIVVNKNYNTGADVEAKSVEVVPNNSKKGASSHFNKDRSPQRIGISNLDDTSNEVIGENCRTPSRLKESNGSRSNKRDLSHVVERQYNSRLEFSGKQIDAGLVDKDKYLMTQSLEEMAVKKVKKRRMRDANQHQYVIVDDPNQLLPKRKVKKVKSPTTAQQKVYLAVHDVSNQKKNGNLQHMALQQEGTHFKLTKVNNSISLKKVAQGKEAGGQTIQPKRSKQRQLIHNSSLKFQNHRSGSNSPHQAAASLPFQIAPNQNYAPKVVNFEDLQQKLYCIDEQKKTHTWFKSPATMDSQRRMTIQPHENGPPESSRAGGHNRVSSYDDGNQYTSRTGGGINWASICSSLYRGGNQMGSTRINQEMIRPNTNASAFTNDSLGLTQRSILSQATGSGGGGAPNISKLPANVGLVSSRKQGQSMPPGNGSGLRLQTSQYHGRNSKLSLIENNQNSRAGSIPAAGPLPAIKFINKAALKHPPQTANKN